MLEPRKNIDVNDLDRVIKSLKRHHNIEVLYFDTGILEEFAIRKLIGYYDDPEVREAFQKYYNRYVVTGSRVLLVADTHLCGAYGDFDIVNSAYRFAKKEGCGAVIHLGDVIEGDVSPRKSPLEIKEQVELVKKYYPYEGLNTFYIQGNHDIPNPSSKTTLEVFRKNLDERSDLIWVGAINSYLNFNGRYFLLHHGDAYNLTVPSGYDYSLQLNGHSHKKDFDGEKTVVLPPLCLRSIDNKGPRFTILTEYPSYYELETFNIEGKDNIKRTKDTEKVYVKKM